jgi:nicotinamidase-related amidase
MLVIHTAHVLMRDGSNIGALGEMVPKPRAGMLNRGAKSAALHKGLIVDARDLLIEKRRFGSFPSMDLELILRSRGIDPVILSGHLHSRLLRHPRLLRYRSSRSQCPGLSSPVSP